MKWGSKEVLHFVAILQASAITLRKDCTSFAAVVSECTYGSDSKIKHAFTAPRLGGQTVEDRT